MAGLGLARLVDPRVDPNPAGLTVGVEDLIVAATRGPGRQGMVEVEHQTAEPEPAFDDAGVD